MSFLARVKSLFSSKCDPNAAFINSMEDASLPGLDGSALKGAAVQDSTYRCADPECPICSNPNWPPPWLIEETREPR